MSANLSGWSIHQNINSVYYWIGKCGLELYICRLYKFSVVGILELMYLYNITVYGLVNNICVLGNGMIDDSVVNVECSIMI